MSENKNELHDVFYVQDIDVDSLDAEVLKKHIETLSQLAHVSQSGITLFDHSRKEHIFASKNFVSMFCNDENNTGEKKPEMFTAKIHPDDIKHLNRNGIACMKYFFDKPASFFQHIKLISEFRALIGQKYVRVIEQFQVLEFDAKGNVWLSLSMLDISPNQNPFDIVQSKILNVQTAEVFVLPEFAGDSSEIILSEREKTILNLIREGKLSKEISDILHISVFTVNTHRQRILRKLNANSTTEAIFYASKLGLIG